jgi:hypothetical protein
VPGSTRVAQPADPALMQVNRCGSWTLPLDFTLRFKNVHYFALCSFCCPVYRWHDELHYPFKGSRSR